MQDIAIYGAGGLGREVACLIRKINEAIPTWNLIGFFDDGKQVGEQISHFGKVLGGINDVNEWSSPLNLVLAFGVPKTIHTIHEKIKNPLVRYPNIIDPSFSLADPRTFNIGKGNIIVGNCAMTTNIKIGNFNLLNGGIIVGHDAVIGNYNVLMYGTKVCGSVEIGSCNLFGMDCFIMQGLKIGENVTVSPLSALLSNPKNGNTYIGNPAKKFSL